MPIWLIEPHDPIILRDGRPFGPDPGVTATSLPFPFPSTTTGAVRTRAATNDNGVFKYTNPKPNPENNDKKQLDNLKTLRVRGPLLVQLDNDTDDISQQSSADDPKNKQPRLLVPMPLDAAIFRVESKKTSEDQTLLHRFVPLGPPSGSMSDLEKNRELKLVGLENFVKQKPLQNAPQYWYWSYFEQWLLDPEKQVKDTAVKGTEIKKSNDQEILDKIGLRGPAKERRVHVRIDPAMGANKEGMLFETNGLEFTVRGQNVKRLSEAQRLALAVDVEESIRPELRDFTLKSGMDSFGSERRMVHWRKSSTNLPPCPKELIDKILADEACRLILLTPAYFNKGFLPKELQSDAKSQHKVTLTIEACAVQRPQVISGWDLEKREPKKSRNLAPSGSVYFLSMKGEPEAIETWIQEIWMQCVSDQEQDRRDGFGLAVLGTWSGKPKSMGGKEKEDA
jgi:CRISPR-associated protein Cmr3